MNLRRVVTGHDKAGRAVVKIDEISTNIRNNRPGATSYVIWSTNAWPISSDDETDPTLRVISTTEENGTVFRIIRYDPGVVPRRHRTDSIDYAVVLSGEIDMELDGETVHLRAGDTLVQRATVHNWVNRGSEPCIIAFVLVSAKSPTVDGKPLEAHG
ncbi:cupin domain-containing protein [Methylocella sp. CPCC 101449]|uniref:cupin domain-containing protein n=1 Tax=Methylocella sp. CPCC 101449 TaxID=2987531 RepID=UPI0028912999|nr:cupin domain-containing protein [Methylocella sp. CPCC 101449]MDT2021101.1 cupin domain-containing protein [Methylocella sp. CPCC 101449]